jgi:hypothetical protein
MDSSTDHHLARMRDAIETCFAGQVAVARLAKRLEALLDMLRIDPPEWRAEFRMSCIVLGQHVDASEPLAMKVLSRLLAMVELQLVSRRACKI